MNRYNPSAYPPITRDHLLVLWQNGLPRQKAYKADDVIAIPLTQPASFNGYAFDLFPDTAAPSPAPKSNKAPIDQENHPSGLTTNSSAFKIQAVEAAAEYTKTDDPAIIGFSRLDEKHRLNKNDHKGKENGREEVTITTVELMPPRHPPAPRIFIPPLRVLKVIWDWIRRKKRDEEEEERSKGGKRRRGGAVRSEIPQEILSADVPSHKYMS
jgi:putative membrane protein